MTEMVYVLVKAEIGKEFAVKEELAKVPNGKILHAVTGPYDYLVQLEGEDMKEIGKVLYGTIRQIDGVGDTLTLCVIG